VTYVLNFRDHAKAQFLAMSPGLRAAMRPHLGRLAATPVSLSMPGTPPASLPDRQIFAFPFESDGRKYTGRVHFRYGTDEQTLYIIAISAIDHG
jgi:hypothetical protein